MAVSAPRNTSCEASEAASTSGGPGGAFPCDPSVLPQSGYLTADWVKRHYSISNSTLYKWLADSRDGGGNGFPAPLKIGPRAVRWSAESLRKFEASLTEGGH